MYGLSLRPIASSLIYALNIFSPFPLIGMKTLTRLYIIQCTYGIYFLSDDMQTTV